MPELEKTVLHATSVQVTFHFNHIWMVACKHSPNGVRRWTSGPGFCAAFFYYKEPISAGISPCYRLATFTKAEVIFSSSYIDDCNDFFGSKN